MRLVSAPVRRHLLAAICLALILPGTLVSNLVAQIPSIPTPLLFCGDYSPRTQYFPGEIVQYQSASYVSIKLTRAIAPSGEAQSALKWIALAQPGNAGLQGPAGLPGPQGAQGPAGLPGAQGIQGVAGPSGPTGPTGATGPAGSSGKSGPSFLAGRNFAIQGDSISTFGGVWRALVANRTGMTEVAQNYRPGRRFDQAFEEYGVTTPGAPLLTNRGATNTSTGTYSTGTPGNTLAQDIADVDLLIIELGTNDEGIPLGALGDATSAGTFFGNMRWVVETYLAIKPSMRIIMVTPQYNSLVTPAVTQKYVGAELAYAQSIGIPIINMFALGGLNAFTASTLTVDGTHPTDIGYSNFYGPVIAQNLQLYF